MEERLDQRPTTRHAQLHKALRAGHQHLSDRRIFAVIAFSVRVE
jgi:hypothetical protein